MNHNKFQSLAQKAFVAMSSLVLALGLGIVSSSAALANENHHGDHRDRHHRHHRDDRRDDDRFVVIRNISYDVRHDGNGPYVDVSGTRYYLDSGDNNNSVVVGGVRYGVQGSERHRGGTRHEGDRHHRHHRHHHED